MAANAVSNPKKADGSILIGRGELFCRVDVGNGELCERNSQFATAGGLRAHLKTHNIRATPSRRGRHTSQENRDLRKFYIKVMKHHDDLVNGGENPVTETLPVATGVQSGTAKEAALGTDNELAIPEEQKDKSSKKRTKVESSFESSTKRTKIKMESLDPLFDNFIKLEPKDSAVSSEESQ
ncbi:MAG: hypothetical protein M1829_002752 [Trizodia sp. TS-e1964]|nr:MAG: hypothetical protein M1829_002752 [Trizodia sp. TS-e1964]